MDEARPEDDEPVYRWPVSTPEEIRAALDPWKQEPAPTPEGGWTSENVGPELGRIMRASRPIVIRLPPEAERRNAEYERYAYGTGIRL